MITRLVLTVRQPSSLWKAATALAPIATGSGGLTSILTSMSNLLFFAAFVTTAFLLGKIQHALATSRRLVRVKSVTEELRHRAR